MRPAFTTIAAAAILIPAGAWAENAQVHIMADVITASVALKSPGNLKATREARAAVVRGYEIATWMAGSTEHGCTGVEMNWLAIADYSNRLNESEAEEMQGTLYLTSVIDGLGGPDSIPDWCGSVYRLFGPNGSMIPNLIKDKE